MQLSLSILVLAAGLLITAHSTQTCTPKFLLEATVQQTLSIYAFVEKEGSTEGTYEYKYFPSMFQGRPTAIMSLSSLKGSEITGYQYQLDATVQPDKVVFVMRSRAVKWALVQVQLLLHSREDLFSTLHHLNVVMANRVAQVDTAFPEASPAARFAAVTFVHGVSSSATSALSYKITAVALANSVLSVKAEASVSTSFKIQTVYFNTMANDIAYAFNTYSVQPSSEVAYRSLEASFAPVYYVLAGVSSVSYNSQNIDLSATFDISSQLLKVQSLGVTELAVTFLAIGEPSKNVGCDACDAYISVTGCLERCPANFYPETFQSGGKTCRRCATELGQTLSSDGSTCECSQGKSYHKGNCYTPSQVPPSCRSNQILIEGACQSKGIFNTIRCDEPFSKPNSALTACICIEGYQKVQNVCVQKCPLHSSRSQDGICVCQTGYFMNSQQVCESICPNLSHYDQQSRSCVCQQNYEMTNGECLPCGSDQSYDPSTKKCLDIAQVVDKATLQIVTVICKENEKSVNGRCECNDQSIKTGQSCTPCPAKSFKASYNECKQCPAYHCFECSSSSTCTKCETGFKLQDSQCVQICGDGRRFDDECDDGDTDGGDGCSSQCKVEPGYHCEGGNATSPDVCKLLSAELRSLTFRLATQGVVYVGPGIATDFEVNPPTKMTRSELYEALSIEFTNEEARPIQILLSQDEEDYTSIRCFFNYHSQLPLVTFTVTYRINMSGASAVLRIPYDPLGGSITSALDFTRRSDDILS